jgi:hypothetical protein
MTITYYLFIDKEFCIRNVFETLQTAILEPGITYTCIKEHVVLPPYIVIVSIYKDQYLLTKIREVLDDIGYDKSFEILKPLCTDPRRLDCL